MLRFFQRKAANLPKAKKTTFVQNKIIGIIPSRYASSRFPGKPLVEIKGKPMIQRVYEQASQAKSLTEVIVATDDKRIADIVKSFGGKFTMTSAHHQSGTDRCAEVLEKLENKPDVVINIQGDEPFIQPEQIDLLASLFENEETKIGTLKKEISNVEDIQNPSIIKVLTDVNDFALYFSRSPLPHVRNSEMNDWLSQHTFYKHIGIYAYRSETLKAISSLKPSFLELAEHLEQLRWLENGYKIKVAQTEFETVSIDTPDDLKKLH